MRETLRIQTPAVWLYECCGYFSTNHGLFIEKDNLRNTFAYIDDIIIGGATQEKHDENLATFQSAASDFRIQLNTDKCRFSQKTISFLGHIISGG